MNKEDKRTLKQPYNEIDTECLDYIVNELKNNRSMQQMLNYYKGKYYSDRYWEIKKQVDKAIDILDNSSHYLKICVDNDLTPMQLASKILRGEDNE